MASEFSLQAAEDFWPAPQPHHPPLQHPTALRARPPARRAPSPAHKKDAAVYYIASADQPDHQDSLEVEELVLADYVSSHSYLDSILTTINLEEVNLNVEFPEYGKRLMETPVENSESQAAIRTKTWGDNWQVDGVERFEEQVFIELLQDQKKKSEMSVLSPEIVPFLVPSSGLAKVIIGDQDLDNVSLLSEKMSEGSIVFSSSTASEEEATA